MKEIPSQLQCAYCIRNSSHGGECHTDKNVSGCLVFKADEKGCIRNGDRIIRFPLYRSIPPLNIWNDGWTLNKVSTEIRIKRIYSLDWDTNAGELLVSCNVDYYINEYHEDFKEEKKNNYLRIVK